MQDPSSMSDAELLAALGQPAAQPQAQARQAAAAPIRAPSNAPRGIRNNNPGNVEDGAFARSLPGYAGSDGRFARFDTPEAGENVAPALLQSYHRRGFDTPNEIINRWAPPSDNNPTQAYAQYVAQRVGVDVNQQITPDQIPLVAAAIKEFENGSRVSGQGSVQAPAGDFGSMSDEALLAALQEPEAPADQPSAPQMYNGRPVEISVTDPIQTDASGAYDLSNPTSGMDMEALRRGDRVTLEDGLTRTLRGTPYTDNSRSSDQRVGSFNLREPNATDTVGAYATASTEQIPFADEAADGLTAMLNGQSFSERRAQSLQQRERMNQTDGAARDAGGWTGFGLGLAAPGGAWVQGGRAATRLAQGTMAGNQAMRMARAGRAGALGAGYGAVYGAGAAEGGLENRAPAGAIGGVLGGVTGPLFQIGADRLARGAAQAQPNAARRLSRQGVDLLPGQMMSEVPVVGQVVKYAEDALGAFNPFMGGVRARQDEQVIRAAGNEALGHIGVSLPDRARSGYEVSQAVIGTLGNAYDEILPRVSAQADDELGTGIRDMMGRASETLDDSRLSRLNRILNDHVVNRFAEDGTLAGEQFKRIETTLRQQSERANRPNSTLEDQDLSEFLDEARNIVRDLIARQNPAEAARIRQINAGYAVGKRVQRAVSGSPQMAREGTPTPGELTQTVRQMSSDGQVANQSALLQRLASDARTVLPPRMGDTGSGQRAVIGGALGVLGTGGAAAVNPLLAGGLIAGAGLYSRPGVAAMNAAYRMTDRPGATAEGLSALAAAARQNPALVPLYERALLQSQLAGQSPGQSPAPRPAGLFGSRAPRMAPQ